MVWALKSMDVYNEAEVKTELVKEGGDEKVLQFLDSLDGYLTLMDSVNSKLREGWFDLASARHSMGALRINSTLLDLKYHPTASTLQVSEQEIESLGSVPRFALSKGGSGKDFSSDANSEIGSPQSTQLRYRGGSEDKPSANDETVLAADKEIKKERAKSLSMFGGHLSCVELNYHLRQLLKLSWK